MTIATTSVALHHKLCHILGGFGLPHAETHSIVLPHALRYNAQAAPEAMRRIARALGAKDAPSGMWELEKRLGIPMRLADIGMKPDDIERAANVAVQTPYPNPRKVEYQPVLQLLHNAFEGARP
jgi:maleylacetate reductase